MSGKVKMRIGFDMQALQSVNSIGGIGKYNHNFLRCLFRLYPHNEYFMFFNGRYRMPDIKQDVQAAKNIHSTTVNYFPYNDLNRLNKFVQYAGYRVKPLDLLHVLSPFEEQHNAVILNRCQPAKTIATIYDFIPYIFKNLYLSSGRVLDLYQKRLELLKSASLILSISESTKNDAVNLFNIRPEKIVNIGLAVSDDFYKIDASDSDIFSTIKAKYQIEKNFILTVGNLDPRKNLAGLLRAYTKLPGELLEGFSLIVVCNSEPEYVSRNEEINQVIKKNDKAAIKFLYSIPSSDLNVLYNSCLFFICASLYEGGGLPVLEAMKCGAPVIASNISSIPEYVGRNDMLFNPKDTDEMVHVMTRLLTDEVFRGEISLYGSRHSMAFTWENVVKKAVDAYDSVLHRA